MNLESAPYRGRFAPTPSGGLHFGSLVAALGSYLEARSQGGEWLVRMEDLDPPRNVPGAADRILRTLEHYGFRWDGPVLYPSRRVDAYRAALDTLQLDGQVYPCTCTRKAIEAVARRGVDGPVYPGTCRAVQAVKAPAAWRFRAPVGRVAFEDGDQGRVGCDLGSECGDFVLRRADEVYAYQLAVVVDDAAQGISHVVRGADLLTSTPRQIALQRALGLPTPVYRHLSVALDAHGEKLSKQTLASPIDDAAPLPALRLAAAFLRVPMPGEIADLETFWGAAITAWPQRLPQPIRGRRPNLCKS